MENIYELYYKGEKIKTKVPLSFIKENLDYILNKSNIDKYITDEEIDKLSRNLPNHSETSREYIENIIKTKNKFNTPTQIFSNMIDRKYFSEAYQANINRLKLEAIEDYIDIMEDKYSYLKENYDKCFKQLINRDPDLSYDPEISIEEAETNIYNNNLFYETNSIMASSGYTTINSDEEARDQFIFNQDVRMSPSYSEALVDKPKNSNETCEGTLSDERFKNLKVNKNQLTIRPRTQEEIEEFHSQEVNRYKNPHTPWTYHNTQEGTSSVVAPVVKKIPSGVSSKPRDHVMLKSDRPSYVTILCLTRDAASRMPEGVGTRADICDLLKDSQYINERLSDSQVSIFIYSDK